MIGIAAIGHALGSDTADAEQLAARLGIAADFVKDKLGTRLLPRLGPGQDTADLAAKAVHDVLSRRPVDRREIRVLVVCTQSPDGEGLPHTSALVQDRAGLGTDVAALDISLGCSGFVYGLSVVEGLLRSTGGFGLLVTADPYSKMIDPDDRDTALLFGDAATATLVGPGGEWAMGARRFGTDGSGATALVRRSGRFRMAGRQVFNFAATRVPEQVRDVLREEGIGASDIDLWALHQGSKYIVETLADRLDAPRSRVPVMLGQTGNTVSSSIPLVLGAHIDRAELRRILICGFGVGLSWATMVLSRTSPP